MKIKYGIIILIFLLSACGNSTINQQSLNSENSLKEESINSTESTPTAEPSKEDPDLLLSYAQRYYDDNNLTEVNIILNKIKESNPDAIEQIDKIQSMSSELLSKKQEEEEKNKELEAARLASILDNMHQEFDEVTEVTWYRDMSSAKYVNENAFYLYFGKKEDTGPALRLKIQFAGDDWLFIDRYIVKADDETFEITPEYGEVNRDNDGGQVWEYYEGRITSYEYKMINAIITSEKTIVRHQGDQYHHDRTITSEEKNALKNVLEAFQALGGELPKD